MAAAAPALPAVKELPARAAWRAIDFISDLHMARNTPRTFEAWAAHLLHTPAEAVFILGDLFEVWVGDDARRDDFEARCASVLTAAASQRYIAFMVGNRDFPVGPDLLQESGVTPLPDPTVLQAFEYRVLLTHGDMLCLSDTDYQQFRYEVRSAQWRADFLAKPLAQRRSIARQLRDASEQRRRQGLSVPNWGDIDTTAAIAWMREADAPVLVHGHTHQPISEQLAPGFTRHVLTDWNLDDNAQDARAGVLRLAPTGFSRVAPCLGDPTSPAT